MRIAQPTDEAIAEAAEAIRNGKLVIMPTETVYGLAADATNPEAVKSIFEAKGRPTENPLIVHVAEVAWLDDLVTEVPGYARKLIEAYWPGPLTLVLRKSTRIPDVVTAGLDTVAVRMPAHPVAQLLIEEAGVPVAAPSANRFMGLSPTRADHVNADLAKHAVMILDGGPCQVGLESTVVDCTGADPVLLRPGNVERSAIEAITGPLVAAEAGVPKRSPGLYLRHYAPKTPVRMVDRIDPKEGGLTFQSAANPNQINMPAEPEAFAAVLYSALHVLDEIGLSVIYVERPPDSPAWEAIWDRLRKAASET